MTLASGSRLGPYEIVSPLGAGGMGEVYKARDTRLERTVAVKVLASHKTASPETRQRFEREAKTISQLSHPHICALYDVGREGETEYLVMELLEGETLSERLSKGALASEQMLRFGTQIADALDKAHRQGFVHRDLKPANVMLTKSGVKLLDFGLAKAMAPADAKSSLTSLPTQQGLTQEGTILGTFQYMAPEQLEGKEADARTDIFAFGAVLYEMATGKKAFSGTSQASLISSIMTAEPNPISKVQPLSPQALDRIVGTCIAKDPEERWQSAADIKRELRWIAEGSQAEAGVRVSPPRRRLARLSWFIAGALLSAAAMAWLWRPRSATRSEPMLLSIVPPQRTILTDSLEISPDGKRLAFSGIAGARSMLRVRDLGSDEVQALPGTETAESPFWSPDGRFLGFYSRGKLRRIELATGSIEVLCDAELGRGGSWGSKGDILFTQKSAGAIYRLPASGGIPAPVTRLEPGDSIHRWPHFLPDGRRFLYFVKAHTPEATGIYLASLDSLERRLVVRNGAAGQILPPDVLLFVRGETLLAQRLDPERGVLLGDPEAVTRPIMRAELAWYRDLFTVSPQGVVVFRPGSAERRLVWLDRHGTSSKPVGASGVIMNISLSFDNRMAAYTLRQAETGMQSIWTLDLERDLSAPFAEAGWMPVFTPDGSGLLFRSETGQFNLHLKSRRDQREETLVVDHFVTPSDVSADGRYVLYTRTRSSQDIGVVSLTGDRKPELLLASEHEERGPGFSPDARWFTYSSSEPGQHEVYVRRFPITDEKWMISSGGGIQPIWSRDGKEIFYAALDGRLMAVPVSAGATFSWGTPQPLFRSSMKLNTVARQYAVSADGKRILMVVPTQDFDSELFRVLVGWKGPSGRQEASNP